MQNLEIMIKMSNFIYLVQSLLSPSEYFLHFPQIDLLQTWSSAPISIQILLNYNSLAIFNYNIQLNFSRTNTTCSSDVPYRKLASKQDDIRLICSLCPVSRYFLSCLLFKNGTIFEAVNVCHIVFIINNLYNGLDICKGPLWS